MKNPRGKVKTQPSQNYQNTHLIEFAKKKQQVKEKTKHGPLRPPLVQS